MQKVKQKNPVRHACADPDNSNRGGGGGGGSNCFSREVRTSFSSRKRMATYDFHGEVRIPCPLCLRPYRSFKQFEFAFYLFIFFAGQFTKRLLIISADAKGKDSMILLKIKETAHINSGHVLFYSLGSHVMMALTQENVHYTLNSGQGVMNRSNRVHAGIQEFSSGRGGGGGVEARRPENSLDNVFF